MTDTPPPNAQLPNAQLPNAQLPNAQLPDAQIFDVGYRTYDGPRTGLSGAARSLVVASLRSSLGLGRKFRHKIVPLLTIATSYLPAIIFIGVVSLLGFEDTQDEQAYYGYYDGFMFIAVVLMASFMVPQLLCTDRRTGMLGVYLSSPLNRVTYLASKAVASLTLLLSVTLGPVLLLMVAYSLQGVGPEGFGGWVSTFLKVVASSLILGGFLTSIALAISSATDRWSTAVATIIGTLLASGIVTTLLVDDASMSPAIRLFSLTGLPRTLIHRIFDDQSHWTYADNPTWTLIAAAVAWVSASLCFVWFNYRKLLVRR